MVGGYTPEKIALRRAISLAYDADTRFARSGVAAFPRSPPVVPHTTGYDPKFKSEMGELRPGARQGRCSTCYGYVDRDGDGWRELPDGRPLTVEMASQPDDYSRKFDELWKKNTHRGRHSHRSSSRRSGPRT